MPKSLNAKVRTATKWSTLGEVVAKLVAPVSSMILARLLTPEAFGVVAAVSMIISIAETVTDAGFHKYLVQHEFEDAQDRDESTNVAFWSNFVMSMVIWGIIAIFSSPLAALVGNPGLGNVLIVACVSIPLAAFSSIQMGLFKRDLDFKTLALVRIVSTVIPLLVTVPLALWLRSYWALIIGTTFVKLVNAILLTVLSKWKPRWFYSFAKLKEMLPFTVWSMIEDICIWLTSFMDIFIVGTVLSQYYLGLYKTSTALVGHAMALITLITIPILYSALSRLQNDEKEFQRLFFLFQKLLGMFVLPLGVGIFIFRDLVTAAILGNQWSEAAGFVGLWGLTSAITIVLSIYSREVYRAKGRPKLSVLAQVLYIVAVWPTVLIAVKYGFEVLYTARSLVSIVFVAVNLCIMGCVIKMPVGKMFTNILPSCIAAAAMLLILLLPTAGNVWITVLYAVVAAIIYLAVVMLFSKERVLLLNLPKYIKNR